MRSSCFRNIFYIIVIIVVGLIAWSLYAPSAKKPQTVNISQWLQAVFKPVWVLEPLFIPWGIGGKPRFFNFLAAFDFDG